MAQGQKRTGGRFENTLTDEHMLAIAVNAITGEESQRDLSARLGISRGSIRHALKKPGMTARLAAERARATEAARGRRRRAADRAEKQGANEATVEAIRKGQPVTNETRTKQPERGPSPFVNGQVFAFDWNPATNGYENWQVRGRGGDTLDEVTWREMPREDFAPKLDARVLTPVGSYAYDPLESEDIWRVADIVCDDLPTLRRNDVCETLSRVPAGRTIQFDPIELEDTEPREPDEEPGVVAT